MAENSGIAWTDHTVNPWWGCAKVSPACANCYAEGVDHRFAKNGDAHWGADASRRIRVEAAEKEALRYERRAIKEGRRFKVFCASMADFFEDRPDLDLPRLQFLDVMRRTPHLDWLVLTKRPDNIQPALLRAFEGVMVDGHEIADWLAHWLDGKPPANVWLGTTVESQQWANHRLTSLLSVPAAIHFVSVEPILGPVDLTPWLAKGPLNSLDWVIVGGESGAHARPLGLHWLIEIRNACRRAGVAFFMKQLSQEGWFNSFDDFESFPIDLQIRKFPEDLR
jgi:protein gp37